MADLSQYAKDMSYLKDKASNGSLTSDNYIYQQLKEKARNLPELQRWFTQEIDPYIKYV